MYDIVFASKHDRNRAAFDRFAQAYPSVKWLTNVQTLSQAVAASLNMCMTSMYWLITDDVILHPDLDLNWKTETWDRPYVHIWPTVDEQGNAVDEFAGVYLIPHRYKITDSELETGFLQSCKQMPGPQQTLSRYNVLYAYPDAAADISQACVSLSALGRTEMHWIVMNDVELLPHMDLSWRPPSWDRKYVHVWQTSSQHGKVLDVHTGVYLVPGDYRPDDEELRQGCLHSIKAMSGVASVALSYDIFFISYQEPNADEMFAMLKQRFPQAQRVHGIKGIHHAHLRCAELSNTNMFWSVDADTVVDAEWSFDYRPPDYDRHYLHVWHSMNPVNGLSYGWGGIKLWPTKLVLEFKSNWLDFTTSVGNIKLIPDIVSSSNYNCDQLSTWRSAFRETVKLCQNIAQGDHMESAERLMTWLTVTNDVEWAHANLQGARSGVEYYLEIAAQGDIRQLDNINDFDWLQQRFNNRIDGLVAPDRLQLLQRLRD
jgi:hypothetical protein